MHGRENDTVEVVDEVAKYEVALREEAMQAFWVEQDIFNKSVEVPASGPSKGDFVFYDGPPFATGLPHYGHILAGTIKDAIPRFWTMNGFHVRRQWGWDCHGLPLENLIEKKLGLATKRDIEAFGIKNFNEAAREAVLEYADDWKRIIPRMGRFVDMESGYKTMDSTYTESVWWVFKSLHEKGLVFEGFKSMHLCPRCGTTLSNFEVNQGYKDIKDIAVTVKLKLDAGQKIGDFVTDDNTSLLVWTTTPWTLPGNMAAAVHNDIEYVKLIVLPTFASAKMEGEPATKAEISYVIMAKEMLNNRHDIKQKAEDSYEWGDITVTIAESFKGSELVGKTYQPPFDYIQKLHVEGAENAWKIYHADFVELGEEGTGGVHIAPAFGDDDMKLAQEHGVPIVHHVNESGHFKDFVTDFAGLLVKPMDDESAGVDHKDTDIKILRALQESGKILKKENITHSYPHCWRCQTPLLNYATTSWFVNVPKIKDELVTENDKVNWVPEHVGKNRFGKWLDGARDWAVSRQRYWGAPLPIWKNPTTGEYKVFGSLAELKEYVPKSGNTYLLMRHGEAKSNLRVNISTDKNADDPLTEKGVEQVAAAATELKVRGVDLIIHSGFMRTKMTAEKVAAALGLNPEQIIEDARLIELQAGADLEGKTWSDYQAEFGGDEESFTKVVAGRESRFDVVKRTAAFLHEIEGKYQGKRILIVAHASSLFGLRAAAQGLNPLEAAKLKAEDGLMDNAEVRELPFVPFPHNDDFVLDYHRPYIDEIILKENDVKLERVPDVFDCWFESGSMPYGQHHYPFSCDVDKFAKEHFPAQFIAEGLDQTRGWFYSMLVLGVALFGKSPFENVVVNGLVLAEDGKKMSKSLQNYPDPMELANRVGVDAMRFYLLSSPAVRGEDLNFSEKEVLELQRKNIGRLHNVLSMYEMFADDTVAHSNSNRLLDRWILSRLNQLVAEVTAGYKNYELDKATRPITDFVDDLSVWYLRRSRERLKGEDMVDKTLALATLRYTLRTLALTMAPAMPFYAEYLWQAVRADNEAQSVHLAEWPEVDEVDSVVLDDMQQTRQIVTLGLQERTKKDVKVRQVLGSLHIKDLNLAEEYISLIKEEVNVRTVVPLINDQPHIFVFLDNTLTPELIAEGAVRELMRAIQEKRKALGLMPQDLITLTVDTNQAGQVAIEEHHSLLMKTVGAKELNYGQAEEITVTAGELKFGFVVTKI